MEKVILSCVESKNNQGYTYLFYKYSTKKNYSTNCLFFLSQFLILAFICLFLNYICSQRWLSYKIAAILFAWYWIQVRYRYILWYSIFMYESVYIL